MKDRGGRPTAKMLTTIVLLSLWQAARAQLGRHDRTKRGLGCGVLMAIVALLIHTAVDFNLQIPANAATFVVILAMGWHTRWLGIHGHARHRSTTRASVQRPADIVSLPQTRGPAKA